MGAAAALLSGCSGDSGPWVFGGLALILASAGAAAAGWLLATRRHRAALHQARQDVRILGSLSSGTPWRTSVASSLAPDQARPAATNLDAATQACTPAELDARYDAGATTLADRLRGQQVLPPTVVRRRSDGAAVELIGLPCHDDAGAYAGHLGVAREIAPDQGAAATALGALVAGMPSALIVLARAPGDPAWKVLQANPAARQRFGHGALLAHDALEAALPPGLQPALAAEAPEAEAEGWQWRQVDAGGQTLCLAWQATTGNAEEQASFSYTVSHDLRAPIRVVEGFTRIVKEDYGRVLDRVANDHLDRVLGAASRMNQMIDAMLTLARLSSQPLARQPVNLTQLAGYVIDDLRRGAPEREASVEIEPGLLTQGDPTLLRLVLENLLGNAWKYTGRRAQTRIEFGRETIDGRPVYVVRDNGAGFDMRSAERLFGLFQRLHSANDFPGTGVGLASVRRIVQRHGGEIWADGEPGRGAAFYFTLQDWNSPAPPPRPPAGTPAAPG